MTQEYKELLFKDLSARLHYGVKVQVTPMPSEEYKHISFNGKIVCIDIDYIGVLSDNGFVLQQDIIELKPYLFPLSSITIEQRQELDAIVGKKIYREINYHECVKQMIDFYHKYHLDYRSLIPMGLAFDATGLNIY